MELEEETINTTPAAFGVPFASPGLALSHIGSPIPVPPAGLPSDPPADVVDAAQASAVPAGATPVPVMTRTAPVPVHRNFSAADKNTKEVMEGVEQKEEMLQLYRDANHQLITPYFYKGSKLELQQLIELMQ